MTKKRHNTITLTTIRQFLGHGEGTRKVRIPRGKSPGKAVIECYGSIDPEKHTQDHSQWVPIGTVEELTQTIRTSMDQARQYSAGTTEKSQGQPAQAGPYIYIMAYRSDPNTWWSITKEELSDRMTGTPKDRMIAVKQLEYFGTASTSTGLYRCFCQILQDSEGGLGKHAVLTRAPDQPLRHGVHPIDPLVLQAVERSKAENTREAYRIQWTKFVGWARSRRVPELPARAQDIALYLAELNADGSALSTIQLARSAISHAHKLTGMGLNGNPARSGLVSETLQGIAQDAAPPKQARALLPQDLDAIRRTAHSPRTGRGGLQERPETARKRGDMDIALCLVLRDAGLRGSECAALVWADVQEWQDGTGRVSIRSSKTNRTGRPEVVSVTPSTVQALAAIRPVDHNPQDRIFRITSRQISNRIQHAARQAGLGTGFSTHSGRVGLARNMAANGAPINITMLQGRWKKADTVARYTRAEDAGAALAWIG